MLRPRRTFTQRVVALLSMVLLLPACYGWRPTTVNPATLIAEERPPEVRVTTNGGERMTFENPIISNDTIVGYTDAGVRRLAPLELTQLEVRRFSPVRTTALVVGNVTVFVSLVAAIIAIQPHYRGF